MQDYILSFPDTALFLGNLLRVVSLNRCHEDDRLVFERLRVQEYAGLELRGKIFQPIPDLPLKSLSPPFSMATKQRAISIVRKVTIRAKRPGARFFLTGT